MAALTNTYGYLLVASYLAAIVYGIAVLLCMQYFYRNPKDYIAVKLTVAMLMLLATLQLIFTCGWLYGMIIVNFGKVLELGKTSKMFVAQNALSWILIFWSQLFYVSRVWILSKRKWWMAAIPACPAAALFGMGLYITYVASEVDNLAKFNLVLGNVSTVAFVLGFVTEMAIAVQLCYLLHHYRSGGNTPSKVINRILIEVVNRGVLASILVIVALVLYLAKPRGLAFELLNLPAAQVEVISCLSILVSRPRSNPKSNLDITEDSTSSGAQSSARMNETEVLQVRHEQFASTVTAVTGDDGHGHAGNPNGKGYSMPSFSMPSLPLSRRSATDTGQEVEAKV
ncbi:hypothetical protein D9758_007546 [Tetrapyrgos nigripes]|uniref:DUF6534 domain-containing protein n=1 Tax=Tetrapyrgos nigripes TaxID=182062 RepID=A0A8H5G881_9AGAR|nr:hypothetical protein D9758_007546 [Tetrapyrgos nigripes]